MNKDFMAALKLRDITGSTSLYSNGNGTLNTNYSPTNENGSVSRYFDLRISCGDLDDEELGELMGAIDTLRKFVRKQ